MEAHEKDEADPGALLRCKSQRAAQLEEWRASGDGARRSKPSAREIRPVAGAEAFPKPRRNSRHKEKALAETVTLLVLTKNVFA